MLLGRSTTTRCRSLVTTPLLAEPADEAASAFGTGQAELPQPDSIRTVGREILTGE
jgi:hypothetical protein